MVKKNDYSILLQGIFSFLSFCILNSFERLVFPFFGVVSCKLCNILYFQYEYSLCNHILIELINFWCFVVLLLSATCLLNLSQNTNIIVL